MTYNLIISAPGKEPVLYELNSERIGVGRSAENQIQIDVPEVSSSHFEIEKKGDHYEIIDLKSFNGTKVNGEPIYQSTVLKDEDRILIGETVPAHFLQLAEGADPKVAVEKADASGQKSAAAYVSLDKKVRDLEESLAKKQLEYKKLARSIEKLNSDIEALKSSGADPAQIETMQEDLISKTQRVEALKTDIAELEQTTKTTVKAPPGPISPTVRLNSLNKPGTPARPPGPPVVAPKKPPGTPNLPPLAAPKKPPSV